MGKVIERTANYTILNEAFDGRVLTLRKWHDEAEGADILFTDTFAQACGYASTADMIAQTIGEQGKQAIIARYGYLPKWVRVLDDGNVYFVADVFYQMGEA